MSSPIDKQLLTILVTTLAMVACSGATDKPPAQEHSGHAEPDDHSGHGHGDDEPSDLDRPVGELFAADCEHASKAHACDECRYEVGVVKAPANLFDGGLLALVEVEQRTVAIPLRLTGEVRFDDRLVAHVSTQAEGIIRKVHVTLGDKVTRGQAMVVIDSVEVGEAQAAYLEAKGLLALARQNHDRLASLRKEGISAEKEVMRAKQEMDAARIRVDAGLGRLTRLGMSRAAARALTQKSSTGRLVLRSPADGTVLKMHAVAGEVAKSETSLVTVGNNASLWVWADLYERDLAQVATAQARAPLSAQVSVKAFIGQEFPGTVDFISPAMDESSRTIKLRIAVANGDGRLLAGMFADVDIFLPGEQQVMSIPRGAVLEDDGRKFVFIHHQGDYYVRRPVVVGRSFASWVEIRSGLDDHAAVVAEGAFLLKSDVLRAKMGAGCAD